MKKCSSCGKTKAADEFNELRGQCKTCRTVYVRQYQQKNKDKLAGYHGAYYQNNKAGLTEKGKQYRQEHKAEIAARDKKYKHKHKSKRIERAKEYHQENKEKIVTNGKLYRQAHKAVIAAYLKKYSQTPEGKAAASRRRHKRRAQKANAECEKFDSIEIFERDNWRCQRCGKKVSSTNRKSQHPLYPNLDHIIALSNGGAHTRKNTQLLCHKCNSTKHNNDSGEQLRLFGI